MRSVDFGDRGEAKPLVESSRFGIGNAQTHNIEPRPAILEQSCDQVRSDAPAPAIRSDIHTPQPSYGWNGRIRVRMQTTDSYQPINVEFS